MSVNLTCDQLKKDEDDTESAPMYGRFLFDETADTLKQIWQGENTEQLVHD